MIQCIKTELYKTTHNRYFIISLFSLLLLIVVHIALNIIPYYGMIYGEYPETVYTNPTAYLFIYIAIEGFLVSFFSLLVVLAAKIIQNIYAAVCCPMVVVIVLKIVLGFINAENYIPMRILYPSTSEGIKTANVVMVIALTGVIGIIGMICEVGKYET